MRARQETPAKQRPRAALWLLGIAGFFALIIVVGCIGASVGAIATGAAVRQPTVTSQPVEPTSTQAPATPTVTMPSPVAQPTASATSQATATSARPPQMISSTPAPTTRASEPTATPVLYASGGLGLTLSEWEAAFGKGETVHGARYYMNEQYHIFFWNDTKEGLTGKALVETIFRNWADDDNIDLEQMRADAATLMPDDAELLRTGAIYTTGVVDEWHSESLAGRYPMLANFPPLRGADPWWGGKPGVFTVEYATVPGNAYQIHLGDSQAGK